MVNQIFEEDLHQINSIIKSRGDWREATIVITGCAGFLGYYFMNYFIRFGSDLGIKKIIGLDNFILGKPDWLKKLENNFSSLLVLKKFDISKDDFSQVENISKARYVIHGASIASPSFYRKFPLETIDANIWGLRKLFDYYKDKNLLKGFLFFSSSEIYGDPNLNSIPTNEEYRGNVSCFGPRACYDESKRFGETLSWIYANKFKMPITIARPFNNYGPGLNLNDKRLPADFASQVLKREDLVILSDGTPTRTFCYVSDAIIGYLLCLTHGKYDYFNIGIDKPEIMVKEFAETFRKAAMDIFDYKGTVNYKKSSDVNYLIDNPNRRCPSIDKARKVLGYNPVVGVEEGVSRYLRFLKNNIMANG